ncbi:MAG: FKBP-type peptidyl-prolyl cis-trans isomerase [Acidimicrobiales bacterium]
MSRVRTWSIVMLSAAALALAGCSSTSSATTTAAGQSAPTATVSTIPPQERSPAGTSGTEPTVTVPSEAPPTQLESSDLIIGTGPAVKDGDTVSVQYVLATYSSGKTIQSSWDGQPFSFTLGKGQVIKGWDEGVVGMKAGGRRELIIPASLGYGASSPGAGIAPNDTLVFIVDLQKIG